MENLINSFIKKKNNLLQITCTKFDNPSGFGRIITKNNQFYKIVEDKDCNSEELKVQLCNAGIYVANINILCKYLPFIDNKNAQNEYYLTDIVEIIKNKEINNNKNTIIDLYEIEKIKQIELSGINTKEQLDKLNNMLNN